MKHIKKWHIIAAITLVILGGVGILLVKRSRSSSKEMSYQEFIVSNGSIEASISATGTVEPQNRLELKPSIAGRVDEILVKEGDKVKKGSVLAWLSSTERAALLDAAATRSDEEKAYWSDAYKPTPLISPIDGDVIVRAIEPGQTVSPNEFILVLSDRLILKAWVDETDIGKVKAGQRTVVTLDAYPEVSVTGLVNHISYESKVNNNVTVYEVDIVPDSVPDIFRSGMSAETKIIWQDKDNIPVVPIDATFNKADGTFVNVPAEGKKGGRPQEIGPGISDDTNVEVLSGLTAGDVIIIKHEKYSLTKAEEKSNPFMPFGKRSGTPRGKGGPPH